MAVLPNGGAVDSRLKAKHFTHSVRLLEYQHAGHAVFGQPRSAEDPHLGDLTKEGGSI